MKEFPNKFLKGIPNSEKVDYNDAPTSDLFYFQDNHERNDNFDETSINWNDDEESCKVLLNQMKNGTYQFKSGYAIMCRHSLDELMKKPLIKGVLKYERNVLPHNIYHGNILLDKSVPKKNMQRIAATIVVTCFEERIPNSDLETN